MKCSIRNEKLQIWNPVSCRLSFLKSVLGGALEEAHNTPSGHFGINKTLKKIRKRFYWATCKKDVEDWCKSCVAKKSPLDNGKFPMQIFAGTAFEKL